MSEAKFIPDDDVCGECGWLSEENCAVCPMRKWHDAQKPLTDVRNVLDYLRKGGMAREYAIQIAICEDVVDSILSR